MSIFSRIFGGRHSALERELHDFYVQTLCVHGFPRLEAKHTVSEVIAACKSRGAAEGTNVLTETFGDYGSPQKKCHIVSADNP